MPENRRKAHFNWILILALTVVAFCAMAVIGAGGVKAAENDNWSSSNALNLSNYVTNDTTIRYREGNSSWKDATGDSVSNIPADARFRIEVSYKDVPKSQIKNGMIYLDLPSLFKAISPSSMSSDVGTISVSDQQVRVRLTDGYLDKYTDKVSGTFTVTADIDWHQLANNTTQTVDIGKQSYTLNFESYETARARLGELKLEKASEKVTNDGYLQYTLTVETGDVAVPGVSVTDKFVYGLSNVDSIDMSSIKVDNNSVSDNIVKVSNSKDETLTWTIGNMEANTSRTLTYRAKLKDSYVNASYQGAIVNSMTASTKVGDTTYKRDTTQAEYNPRYDVSPYITGAAFYYYDEDKGAYKRADQGATIPVDAKLKGSISYTGVPTELIKGHGNALTYQVPDFFGSVDVVSGNLTDNGVVVGQITTSGNIISLTFNEDYLDNHDTLNNATFEFTGTADKNKINENPTQDFTVGQSDITINFAPDSVARLGTVNLEKTASSEPKMGDDGAYYMDYTLTASVPKDGDNMPAVSVKDKFTSGASFIDSIVDVSSNETTLSSEGSTLKETIAKADDSSNPTHGKISRDSSGVMTWNIGDMKAGESRTLTYRAKLKDNYVGLQKQSAITNTATSYSKDYSNKTASTSYNPTVNVTVKKEPGTIDKNYGKSNDKIKIPYTVTVTAGQNNSWTLDNVRLNDLLGGGNGVSKSDLAAKGKVSYQNVKIDGTDVTNNPDKFKLASNGLDFDLYMGDLKPNQTSTITYDVVISKDIYTAGNGNLNLYNSATVYSKNQQDGSKDHLGSQGKTTNISEKVWERKIQDNNKTTETITQNPNEFYQNSGTSWVKTSTSNSKTVQLGSTKYQIVVNEDGQWDVSKATFNDALSNNYMLYSGYLQVDYYENGIGTNASSDEAALAALTSKTPTKTLYYDIDGQQNFTVSPYSQDSDFGNGAFVLTYYASPNSAELANQSRVSTSNTFTLSGGVVGPGGTKTNLPETSSKASLVVEGDSNFSATKYGWYYTAKDTGYTNWNSNTKGDRPAAYWVIDVTGKTIPAGSKFQDDPSNAPLQKLSHTDSLIGLYKGTVPNGEEFTDHYADVTELTKAGSGLQKIENPNQTNPNENKNAGTWTIDGDNYKFVTDYKSGTTRGGALTLKKSINLDSNEHLYIVIATDVQGKKDLRELRTFKNKLTAYGNDGTAVVSSNTAELTANGGGDNFKETGSVFKKDKTGNISIMTPGKTTESTKARALESMASSIPDDGIYIEYRLKINYAGTDDSTIHVTDTLPDGLEGVAVRYFWAGGDVWDNAPEIPNQPDLATQTDKWKDIGLKDAIAYCQDGNKTDHKDAYAYYSQSDNQIKFDVTNLTKRTKPLSSTVDRDAIEVQVIAKVTDTDALKGKFDNKGNSVATSFVNNMKVYNDEGSEITDSNATTDVKTTSLDKKDLATIGANGSVGFKITVNPNGLKLANGSDNTITFVDHMFAPLEFDPDDVTVYEGQPTVSADGSVSDNAVKVSKSDYTIRVENEVPGSSLFGQRIYFTLPDQQAYTVVYHAKNNGTANQDFTINNTVYWLGMNENTGKTVNKTARYSVGGTVSGNNKPTVKVLKVDQSNATTKLPGAVFKLQKAVWDDSKKQYVRDIDEPEMTVKTDKDGVATFDNNVAYDTVYCLWEESAPEGYQKDSTEHYVAIAEMQGTSIKNPNDINVITDHNKETLAKDSNSTAQVNISYDTKAVSTQTIYDKASKTLNVRKELTGNMANRNKFFKFTVYFDQPLDTEYAHAAIIAGWHAEDKLDKTFSIYLKDNASGYENGGTASITMPYGTTYKVIEDSHSYDGKDTNNDNKIDTYTADNLDYQTYTASKNNIHLAESDLTKNDNRTVNSGKDGITDDTTVTFRNDRSITPPDSGIRTPGLIPAIIALGCFALMLTFAACKKRNDE